ncbi:hypothetical protein [Lacinutrix sp.]|uniref:hypothetical protein n=1 Tax=Lacinutrix sp. TaxID=1937692 RepID=UPI0025C453AD|nr:hypothetical protein [Lacinutrix sp.]
MRIIVKTILMLCFITLSSCKVKSYREKFSNYFDLSNQLNFIESNIINSDNNEFTIDIRYGHNIIKTLKSELSVSTDSVRIKSIKESNNQIVIDTIFSMSKSQIIKEIEFQKINAKDIFILAGHYQWIFISKNDRLIRYPTTRVGGYLIEFLENGELHYAKNTTANNV